MNSDYEGKPTDEELKTLRRVPGKLPLVAYLICFVEFAERASYYGVQQLISNFVNRPLPKGGNGWGAPPRGTQETGGALGMGTVKAGAVAQSFNMLVYTLPIFWGWLADTKTGRFKLICWGVLVFGIAHALMVGATAKSELADGSAKIPYFLSLYILAVGAGEYSKFVTFEVEAEKLTDHSSHVQAQRLSTAAGPSHNDRAKGHYSEERRASD